MRTLRAVQRVVRDTCEAGFTLQFVGTRRVSSSLQVVGTEERTDIVAEEVGIHVYDGIVRRVRI